MGMMKQNFTKHVYFLFIKSTQCRGTSTCNSLGRLTITLRDLALDELAYTT